MVATGKKLFPDPLSSPQGLVGYLALVLQASTPFSEIELYCWYCARNFMESMSKILPSWMMLKSNHHHIVTIPKSRGISSLSKQHMPSFASDMVTTKG